MKSLDLLVEKLRKAFGPELVSVILHGSAAAGDHQAKFSDLNVLCVLRAVTTAQLIAAEPVFHWWRGEGNPAPLLLSESELVTSADSFALEFHDIQRHHRILQGTDVVSGLVIDDRFYRAQVEHDLRAKLIRLRQKASGVMSDKGRYFLRSVHGVAAEKIAVIPHGTCFGSSPSRSGAAAT